MQWPGFDSGLGHFWMSSALSPINYLSLCPKRPKNLLSRLKVFPFQPPDMYFFSFITGVIWCNLARQGGGNGLGDALVTVSSTWRVMASLRQQQKKRTEDKTNVLELHCAHNNPNPRNTHFRFTLLQRLLFMLSYPKTHCLNWKSLLMTLNLLFPANMH